MHQEVRDNYAAFTSKFEGTVPYMYLDVKGLVTTGIGNLIDSIPAAQALPWRHGNDGPLATPSEVASAWQSLKNRRTDSRYVTGKDRLKLSAALSDLRLDTDGIRKLVDSKLSSNESILKSRFPGYDAWPADAQLGLLSMAWAMGPYFKFPKFEAAVNQLVPDFRKAAALSHMNAVGNPGLVPRNTANESLFNSAADTLERNLDLARIQWNGFESLIQKGTAALASGLKSGATTAVRTAKKRSGLLLGVVAVAGIGGGIYAYKSGVFGRGRG